MSKRNIIFSTDSYKLSHFKQYPPGTQYVSSYIESRGGDYPFTLFSGPQMLLSQLKAPTMKQVREAEEVVTSHGFEFNHDWYKIAELGYLPIRITAVKEGTVLPTGNVLLQIENTDPRFPWLTSYLETALLRAVWYPTTVATRSKSLKNVIQGFIDKTSDDPSQIDFKLHDFGARGVSSYESADIGGIAHLINFRGTDTLSAVVAARKYYAESMAGFSIPAAEHSTITSWGKEHEADAYRNMIQQFGGKGNVLAVVSDSYDIMNAVDNIWGGSLKEVVLDSGARVVVRPDSGDPATMVLAVVSSLAKSYGTTENSKGYKVLNPAVRVIQGDGINDKSVVDICNLLMENGFAVDNVTFGMGGGLLQQLNRDTLRFAMKCNAIKRNGEWWEDVSKNPSSDTGKKSKAGRLALVRDPETKVWQTVREHETEGRQNYLEEVFVNGKVTRSQSLAQIRALSNQS
jgi:nicotinamide phosphoribosyltransferase